MQALLTATFLLATLLGTADPPDLLAPNGPPEPHPCTAPIPCHPPVATPYPPPSASPATPSTTASPTSPTSPSSTGQGGRGSAGQGTGQGSEQDTGQGTGEDARGAGSAVSPPEQYDPNWWLITIPIAALLALAVAGVVLLIRRSERRPS
jgi:cobalamin biosynthesis Mg chelatase CobN